ncbi:MAG: V-type ATPase subunit [Candidatus Omnitrophica bacterium]|nr:V-type ATPase subunit [Candidatus Omnitrophota bacterium]
MSIAEYAYANAKIRVMLSFLLDEKMLNNLVNARDVYSVLGMLKDTQYKGIIENFEKGGFNISFLEKEFLRNEISTLKKVYSPTFPPATKAVISLLIQKYEIEEIKISLRLWNEKRISEAPLYLLNEKIWFDIDYNKIISSPDLNGIIQILSDTPYKKPLDDAKTMFADTNSVFFLEAYLDKDYFVRLVSAIKQLSFNDKNIANRIIGAMIDMENLNWLIRAKKYYSLEREEIDRWLIKGGILTNNDFVSVFLAGGIKSVYNVSLASLTEKNEYRLGIYLHEILAGEIKKILSGYPFTLGIILSYVLLKTREIKNVISIINAKIYNLSKEEISMLIGQRQ